MKVLLINGSPKEKGCTYTALSIIADALAQQDIESEILHIGADPIGSCRACGACKKKEGCLFYDDIVNAAAEKLRLADGVVFGSPVHFASATGNMTSFLDRLCCSQPDVLRYKPAAICCSARRAGTTATLDQLIKYPTFFHMPLINSCYWPMVHGTNPAEVMQDHEGVVVLSQIGQNMAWVLKCLALGKDAGIHHPDCVERPATNFIR